jgi:hypothetical protein
MTIHHIKITDHWARLLSTGVKTCELRWDDRDYQAGDLIQFLDTDGKRHWRWDSPLLITHVLKNISGLERGWVVLSFQDPEKERLRRYGNDWYEVAESRRRTIAALRGRITKLRNKIEAT